VGAAVRQAQAVIDSLITAVEIVFVFALLGGLLVLYSALVATEDERRREAAVMRVYGASRAQVTGAQRAEFLAMGAIAACSPRSAPRRSASCWRAACSSSTFLPASRCGSPARRRHRAALAQRMAVLAQGAARLPALTLRDSV